MMRQNPRNGATIANAKALRRRQTAAELAFWELVRDHRFAGFKFRRQHRIERYIADFYCPAQGLVVEIDGTIHRETAENDVLRDAMMHEFGLRVLRISNDELLNDRATALSRLQAALRPDSINQQR